MKRVMAQAVVLALLVGFAGCRLPKVRTISFGPGSTESNTSTKYFSQRDSICDIRGFQSCPVDIPDRAVEAGFTNGNASQSYLVLTCWAWQSCQYRGFLRFNLDPLRGEKIQRAILRYSVLAHKTTSPNVFPNSCALSLSMAKSAGREVDTPGKIINSDLPDGRRNLVDVTDAVRRWVEGGEPNHGFIMDSEIDPPRDNNNVCLSFLGEFELKVDVLAAPR